MDGNLCGKNQNAQKPVNKIDNEKRITLHKS